MPNDNRNSRRTSWYDLVNASTARPFTVPDFEVVFDLEPSATAPLPSEGHRFYAADHPDLLDRLPVGTVILGLGDGRYRRKTSEDGWTRVGTAGREEQSSAMLSGAFRILSYTTTETTVRPRYTDGRFVSSSDAARFQIGDVVRFNEIARLTEGLVGEGEIVAQRSQNGNWTVMLGEGRPHTVDPAYMMLVRRPVSAPETFDHFQGGDRVLISDDARASRYGSVNHLLAGLATVETPGYGETDVYTVRSERDNRIRAAWGGSFTLLERDGEYVEGAPRFPPVIRCRNPYCGVSLANEDERVQHHSGSTGCAACSSTCDDCDEVLVVGYDATNRINSYIYCDDCASYCDDCDSYYRSVEEECPNYEDHDLPRGVHSYGHTRPTMWLGGPLPKFEDGRHNGYYIGIELEISASHRQSAMPIYDWADEHLGSRDAIVCKEDSSVRGFEIVTMPMTPQMFESVNWESFMELLNTNHPLSQREGDEPTEHGLHVHIGRVAFGKDDVATAAYSYLLNQGDHLERIGRREAYHYCAKVRYPVSAHISQMRNAGKAGRQIDKIARRGIYAGRDAVNLQNESTIEIRAFRSTRDADYLRNAVRLTYLAADYIRYLRVNKEAVSPKSLHWAAFSKWVQGVMPEAYPSIAGEASEGSNKQVTVPDDISRLVSMDM